MAAKEQDGKRVGIWIRVSTEDQARGESPEHHERRARFYAEAKGWTIVDVYHLEGVSGKAVMDHPETARMVADVRAGKISGLIFSKLARLARSTRELLDFSDIFRDAGADLISLQESIDTTTPAGRLFYTMIAAMAQWEREEIAERVAVSVPVRAKLGKPLGGAAPFGYRWDGQELKVDPKEAPVRKLMYELFLLHKRKKTVARLLNEGGHRTRNGSKFSDTTVDRLLRDPTAKGLRRANYTSSTNNKKAWKLKPESDWIHHPVEAIVSEDLWHACNVVLDTGRTARKRTARKTVQLFAGLVQCSCGGKMYVPSNSPKYICHTCRNKIPVDAMEDIFRAQIRHFSFSSDEISRYLDEADAAVHEKAGLLESLRTESRKLAQETEKLYALYQSDNISKEAFGNRFYGLEERRKQLDDEIPRLEAQIDVMKISRLSREEMMQGAETLFERWPSLPFEEKRGIVESITEQITVGAGEVDITLHYLPQPFRTKGLERDSLAMNPHGCVAFLPVGARIGLKVKKPKRYSETPTSLGEHLLRERLIRELLQKEAAKLIGVSHATYIHWETDKHQPRARQWPGVIRFLGYDPHPEPVTLGERMVATRRAMGWTIQKAARHAGVDEGTWRSIEVGTQRPTDRIGRAVSAVLGAAHNWLDER